MNASAARLCLWICPALIVVSWGFLSRGAHVPFLMVPLVMFALVAAIGTAARTVPRKTLAVAAAVGGVAAIIPGMPLAVLATVPPAASNIAIGFSVGSDGDVTTWTWVLVGLLMISAAVTLCWGAVLLGTTIRRSESNT